MHWKKRLSDDFKLYLILDAEVLGPAELVRVAWAAAAAGAGPLQLRYKTGSAQDIISVARDIMDAIGPEVPFIVNDRADIAMALGAHGVHVGQDDLPVAMARRILGPDKIIGASCQTLAQAREAAAAGADYIGFGSVYKTATKPGREPMDLVLLEQVTTEIPLPVYAIGGIEAANVAPLLQRGVTHIAVCRAVCLAKDAGSAAGELIQSLGSIMEAGHQ